MKKLISILLLLFTLMVSLASCSSLKSYKKNLGEDYKIISYDEDEIEDLCDDYYIDADDYGVSEVLKAKDKKGYYAYIIKCKSKSKAKKLVDDLDYAVDIMNDYYSFKIDAVSDGKFVLVGSSDVIDDALGK